MQHTYSIIFGLTADPIHKGHEQAIINGVEYLRNQGFVVDRFLLIPVYFPNLIGDKQKPVAGFAHRVAMCELVAIRLSKQLKCNISVSQIEKDIANNTGGRNYSLNTIIQLNLKNCLFMVSADHFQGRMPKFRKWFKWQEILAHTGLLINQRPGHEINQGFIRELEHINPDIFIVDSMKAVDVSSTEIRANFQYTEMAPNLSKDICRYVFINNLY